MFVSYGLHALFPLFVERILCSFLILVHNKKGSFCRHFFTR